MGGPWDIDIQRDGDHYWALPRVHNTDGFKVVQWWQEQLKVMPHLAAAALRVLAVPATACDVERCFSSLKWVRKERQSGMKEETHRAACLMHWNGVVER